MYIDLCLWLNSLSDGVIFLRCDSCQGLYSYLWCIYSSESSPGKKETRMFYVDKIITCSVFPELLSKYTLIVRYKLNRFGLHVLNQLDISALLFSGYTRFILLNKCSYMVIGNLPSGSSSMSQLALKLFPLCNWLWL